MKREIKLWQFAGFTAVAVLGTVLHFLYEWTGSVFSALFSGVNESTWEHIKLLFFPMLLVAFVQSFFLGKEYKSFWCIKLIGTLLGMVFIPLLFYTLNGAFGTTPDWINISIFFISAAVAFAFETLLFEKNKQPCTSSILPVVILCVIAILFWVFTFFPPQIPLFADPLNGSFGIKL